MRRLLASPGSVVAAPPAGGRAVLRRRRLASVLGAFLLLAFVPRLLAAGEHVHTAPGSSPECAACVIGHAPALEAAAVEVVFAAPLVVDLSPSADPVTVVRGTFSFASPLACGPPA